MSSAFEMNAGWADSSFKDSNTGKLVVLFHTYQKPMKKKSEEAQRPIFEERIYITKIVPGPLGQVVDREIRDEDKEEYATQWDHWQRTRENKMPGTPIEYWHVLTDTQKAEFKAMRIFTIEQFANMPDGPIQAMGMGMLDLRTRAKAFLESGKDAEFANQIRAEAATRETALQKQLDELRAMLEAKTAPEKVTA